MSTNRKICGKCEQNRAGDGLQHWCRECFREYFNRRGTLHVVQSQASRRRRVAAARSSMADYLVTHPCVDCGEGDSRVLDFDHVGIKRGQVSKMVCCCNCHRRITARRRALAQGTGSTVSVEPP